MVRLFPHEAADLEPCLEAAEEEAKKEKQETWSTLSLVVCWREHVDPWLVGWVVWVKNREMSNVSHEKDAALVVKGIYSPEN